MDEHGSLDHLPTWTVLQSEYPQRIGGRTGESEWDTNKEERIFITQIHATNVACRLRRLPAGFYVAVETDGETRKTSVKPLSIGVDAVEWDEEIILLVKLSSTILFRLFASFELGPTLGHGEQLGESRIPFRDILNQMGQPWLIGCSAKKVDEVLPSCSYLRIITERCVYDENEAIIKFGPLVSDEASQLAELTDSGHHFLLCYRQRQSQIDLDAATACFQRAKDMCSSDHPHRSTVLCNLATAKLVHCQAQSNFLELEGPITLYQDALRFRDTTHPDHCATALNLAFALLVRFQGLKDENDKNEAANLLSRVIELSSQGSHSYRAACTALHIIALVPMTDSEISDSEHAVTEGLMEDTETMILDLLLSELGRTWHHQIDGDLANIDEVISMLDHALEIIPERHPKESAFLYHLGVALSCRFNRLGELEDINESISALEEAVLLTSDHDSDKPVRLCNLGNSLVSRFERLGDVTDINKSISVLDKAVRLTPEDHPSRPARLNNLGSTFFLRFERLRDLADIHRSISVSQDIVYSNPDDHPDRATWLNNLGCSLYSRFESLGDLSDLDKSISVKEEAVRLTQDGDPNKPTRLSNLGSSLLSRFELLDNQADINRSILMKEEAVRLVLDGNVKKPALLGNLSSSLLRRFERFGNIADITQSIRISQEAVRLTPDNHPNKPALLNNLGGLFLCRFKSTADPTDMANGISTLKEAIRIIPDGHPYKSSVLSNLGNTLLAKAKCDGEITTITISISLFEEALHLTPDGHPDKPARLYHLANSFMKYFEHSNDRSHLSAAVSHFSAASRTSVGPASIRFNAVCRWISSAQVEGKSEALLDAYTTAIKLLQELAWVGLPLTERHRVLVDAANVTRDAAAAALEAGFPETAVEWLEQGRSIVWSQILQLRTPVDNLRDKHLALADQFKQICRELDRTGFRDNDPFYQLGGDLAADVRSLEEEVQRHHELALMRETLLDKIRSLPGFDRFLLPKTIEELATYANTGPVIYINASTQRCDALIVLAELGSVLPVTLDIGYQHVQEVLCLMLNRSFPPSASRDSRGVSELFSSDELSVSEYSSLTEDSLERYDGDDREGGLKKAKENTPDDRFRRVLAFLWKRVVHPVIDALGFSTSSGTAKMTRIFWCPTGPFAFLPIHAAGLYGTMQVGTKLSDFAISSYTPTLGGLKPLDEKGSSGLSSPVRLITVPQPPDDGQFELLGVKEEMNYIENLCAESEFVILQDSDGTIEDVKAKMAKADWVHFACHGVQDLQNPLDSGLCLAYHRRLRLSDIIRLARPQGGLAFLSACQTAQGDERLSEESVHLAAGMLLAGYGGIIATMWSIMDSDAPRVTRDVYAHLFRDGKAPESGEAAEALHRAVQLLRDSGASFSSWVPFIHVGR